MGNKCKNYKRYKKNGYEIVKYKCYRIEKYLPSANRWMHCGEHVYITEYLDEFNALSKCWQRTGLYATFSKKIAKQLCKELNNAAKNVNYLIYNQMHNKLTDLEKEAIKLINDDKQSLENLLLQEGITKFRVVEIKHKEKAKISDKKK